MKTKNIIFALALVTGPLVGAFLYKGYLHKQEVAIDQLKLQEILSIKELHLVKHSYTELFFLYRKNDPSKPVRAIARVPVSVTAYLNLKDFKIIKDHDTIRSIVLPCAVLHGPAYEINNMQITRLRAFQLHAGSDQYADVSQFIQEVVHSRVDSVRDVAIKNHILEQAEAEGKDYIETLLKAVGRPDITVTFGDVAKDKLVADVQRLYIIEQRDIRQHSRSDTTVHKMNYVAVSNSGNK